MNKKLILITVFFFIFAIGVVVLLNLRSAKENENLANKDIPQNTQLNIATKVMPSSNLKEYTDPSGFSFSSPDNLNIEKKENEDLYGDLTLSSSEVDGNIAITVSDSKYNSLDLWKAGNKTELTGLLVNESSLGELSGISFNNKDKTTIVVIDQGIEFKIIADYKNQKEYWDSVLSNITSTFSFAAQSSQSVSTVESVSSSEDVVFEGEELVE